MEWIQNNKLKNSKITKQRKQNSELTKHKYYKTANTAYYTTKQRK